VKEQRVKEPKPIEVNREEEYRVKNKRREFEKYKRISK